MAPTITPHLTHLFVSIINSQIYPDTLKVTRISPNLNSYKPFDNIDSYRPICNLSVVDKIFQQYLKDHLNSFFEVHNIINSDHHGSRKSHSTTTALASIQHITSTHYYNNKFTSIIQTDLSAAFDTVDHQILLDKLSHYGIKGKENNLIKAILTNRWQYVDIDGFSSTVTPANPCSVLQGSKLSSLLYVIYCNEIPLLHKLVGSKIMPFMTNHGSNINTQNISHNIVQYVDDSTNIIACTNTHDLQNYINTYFNILEEFYNINKLLINSDKSKLLIITKPGQRHLSSNIKLQTTKYIINQSQKINILGIFITSGFTNLANINNTISKVNYRISVLRELFKYSTYRTKKILTNSIILSVIRYASPILISSSTNHLSKLQVMIMKCSRPILGIKSLKYSTQKIMNELNWLTIYQMVTKETILFFHKVVLLCSSVSLCM